METPEAQVKTENFDYERLGLVVFERLRRSYLIALSLVALAVMIEYLLVESFLEDQRGDAEIINVAGRQRMLSQRIAKLSVLENQSGQASRALEPELIEWSSRQSWLKVRLADQPAQRTALAGLDPTISKIMNFVRRRRNTATGAISAADLGRIDSLSEVFLARMDAVVDTITVQAEAKVQGLRGTKLWLTLVTYVLLLLEALFIFQPILRFVRNQIGRLRAERERQAGAEAVYREHDKRLRELGALNHAIDRASLFAALRQDGTVVHMSRKFQQLLGAPAGVEGMALANLLHSDEAERARLGELLADARAAEWRGEIEVRNGENVAHWLEVTIVPARRTGGEIELFLLANEVTDRRLALEAIGAFNLERLDEEKTRLRVARDLYDGIGHDLTALKSGLEGLRVPAEDARLTGRVEQLRALAGDLIRGVRAATFKLAPPGLVDHGLAPALGKMARELSRLTGERIVFRDDGFAARLTPAAESDLYRITREAVDNAIRHARANCILVAVSGGARAGGEGDSLSVDIDDDGRGFEVSEARTPAGGSGRGLAFMEERARELGGRLLVRSSPGGGTRVSVSVPLAEVRLVEPLPLA